MRSRVGTYRSAVTTGLAIVMAMALSAGPAALPVVGQGSHVAVYAEVATPDSLNPFATFNSFWPLAFTYDFLVGVSAQRQDGHKGFAKTWSPSSDGRTWTFTIWPNMKWSDGQPATANDVAFTFNYIRDSIGKKDELNTGWNNTSGFNGIDSIVVTNDQTVQITMKSPSTWPIDNTILIVPEHIWKSISYADARASFQNPAPLVGSGPMIVQNWVKGQYFQMTSNQYFRAGKPPADGLIFEYFTSNDPIVQGLKSGTIDIGQALTPSEWTNLKSTPNVVAGESPTEDTDVLAFNTLGSKGKASTDAVADPAFRDAIGYAIDQHAIVSRALQGHGSPGVGVIVPVATDYFSNLTDIARHFDLAEAGKRLDAAGYKMNGAGVRTDKAGHPLNLKLITGIFSGANAIPTATVQLVTGWLGQIGVPTTVAQLDTGALSAKVSTPANGGGGWDLAIGGRWYSSFPVDLLNIATSDQAGIGNYSYWSNAQYDGLRDQVSQTVDIPTRKTLIDQAVRLEYLQAPYIFLDYPVQLEAHRSDRFQGWGKAQAQDLWSYGPFDKLTPVTGGASASSTTGPTAGTIALLVVILVVILVGAAVLLRRRRSVAPKRG